MKDKILKYIELNPNRGYYDLCQIFGLSIVDLLKLLDITNYKIKIDGIFKTNHIIIYDTNGNTIYKENQDGLWWKYYYDNNNNNNNKIKEEDSEGYWVKYGYDNNSNLIKEEDSDGYWFKR